ncbi:sterol-sensing domain of SREBP cleavage-activation-domain-containing protein [Podospora didyma]|uniref:Sterol regulatory element-binding protein cleavage-activating protein n=1 Tax=Podospora didyma TaxID=330526 RepID=A0AAE0ND80_9PEZI|nr:sterol-sensing domain of SREBP cleavage-activation-domain-containing protein [Podospora didyma]
MLGLVLTISRTTEAPVLAPTHPLRTAFSRYGTWAARHVKIVLPISTAVVFVLLYMFPFLYTTDSTNITSGLSNLPHHVWTDAQPLGERVNVEPDVVMRSIWIHGSYMKALKRDVLLGALELQDELLGPTTDFNPRRPEDSPPPSPAPSGDLTREERDAFHIINGLTDQSWFFHSPLQYWSGSSKNIAADDDLVSTVNARKRQPTSVNVTLRHSIVFSGKRFEERKLVAADALVITLIHLRDSPVGRQWIRKAETIAAQSNDKWTIIPADGKSTSHQLYEFQFRPLSWTDWGLLLIAYSLTCFYLMVTLSKLRAVKSRIGLMVTIWAQIAASIFSSFTICAIFKVDLSRIPYFAYPLVVLAISVENSLRLINAVITTSWSESISDRIGEAFGATAHVAVANRVQNLLVLFGLSRITFPGVAAFCTFAAVAVIFDFFYLATFFLSVLSVDVRQRELSELEKVSVRQRRVSQGPNPTLTWFDRIRQWFRLGEVTILTRVAGTIVLLGFVLIAQSHYAPESGRQWLNRIFSLSWRAPAPSTPSSLLIDIHQARSPTSWLRLQDHETAREVINVVKPWAHSYVARVYEPLIFVLKGSDRIPHSREPFFLPAVYDFIHHELPRFVVLLLTVMAMILLFTNYLIRDNRQAGGPNHPDDEPLLSVQTISQGHSLDIVMLAASAGGQLVSAGLDRTIQIRDVLASSRNQLSSESDSSIDELTDLTENLFPVLGMTIDEDSRWLALLSRQSVLLWSIEEQQWTSMMEVDLGGHKPEAFFFGTTQADSIPPLMVVRRNGTMAELDFEVEETKDYVICKTPLVWVVPFVGRYSSRHHTPQLSILTASRKSCIHMVTQHGHQWVSKEINLAARGSKDIHCLVPIPGLSMYLVGRSRTIDLVDLDSSVIIHTFQTEPMQPRSLRQISSTRPRQAGLTSLTLSYVNSETGDLVIHTHVPEEDGNSICPDSPLGAKDGSQRPWSGTREIIWRIANPGTWEALSNGSIVGVRRKSAAQVGHLSPTVLSTGTSGLRRRGGVRPDPKLTAINDTWDVWVINQLETKGSIETTLLEAPGANDSGSLVVSELGPIIKLGTMSVAVGFGNVVKLISVGHEYFDQPRDRLEAEDLRNLTTSRRKRGLASSRARA